MDCENKQFPSNSKKTPPRPPPLPSHPIHRKGLLITGLKIREHCCVPNAITGSWDRLFDEGYRADVAILTDAGDVIYAHACVLVWQCFPVFKAMIRKSKSRGREQMRPISIRGVPPEAVRVFLRFLYSSCYEEEKLKEFALPLLVLSHAYAVEQLKRICECMVEARMINTENVIDIFQLALLCDAPRLSLVCHRLIVSNFKAVYATDGWKDMKRSHPVLEKEIVASAKDEDAKRKVRMRKANERKVYIQLYDAMEALVHIWKDGCRTIGPHDKVLKDDQAPCEYVACKGTESLIRHFSRCKMRGTSSCIHCKRMWQILELHSRICANPDDCKVPLCRNLRQSRRKQSKKEEARWRILVKRVVRSKSITGAPNFSLEST